MHSSSVVHTPRDPQNIGQGYQLKNYGHKFEDEI